MSDEKKKGGDVKRISVREKPTSSLGPETLRRRKSTVNQLEKMLDPVTRSQKIKCEVR